MKNLKVNAALFFVLGLSFLTSGCYTVIWTPEKEFPNESNYLPYGSGYYYYDEYYYYYDYPWWLEITPPSKTETKYERDRNSDISKIRNAGDGRGTDNTREILNTPPPTKSSDSGNNSNNNNSNTSGSQTKERVSTESGSNTQTRQSSNDSSNNVRNNDGSRNNNGRK
jgi:hypothetical protein